MSACSTRARVASPFRSLKTSDRQTLIPDRNGGSLCQNLIDFIPAASIVSPSFTLKPTNAAFVHTAAAGSVPLLQTRSFERRGVPKVARLSIHSLAVVNRSPDTTCHTLRVVVTPSMPHRCALCHACGPTFVHLLLLLLTH